MRSQGRHTQSFSARNGTENWSDLKSDEESFLTEDCIFPVFLDELHMGTKGGERAQSPTPTVNLQDVQLFQEDRDNLVSHKVNKVSDKPVENDVQETQEDNSQMGQEEKGSKGAGILSLAVQVCLG